MPVILSQLHRAFDIPSVLPKAGLSEIRHEAGKREWGSAARAFRGQRVYPSTVRAGCCIAGGASRLRAANSSTAATCSRAARRTRHTPFRPPGWLRSARQLLRTAARRSRQGLPRRINILLDTCTIPWLHWYRRESRSPCAGCCATPKPGVTRAPPPGRSRSVVVGKAPAAGAAR